MFILTKFELIFPSSFSFKLSDIKYTFDSAIFISLISLNLVRLFWYICLFFPSGNINSSFVISSIFCDSLFCFVVSLSNISFGLFIVLLFASSIFSGMSFGDSFISLMRFSYISASFHFRFQALRKEPEALMYQEEEGRHGQPCR